MFWQNLHKILISLFIICLSLSLLIYRKEWKELLSKNQSKEIENQNKILKDRNDILEKEREDIKLKFYQDSLKIDSLEKRISLVDSQIVEVDNTISSKKKEIERLRKKEEEERKILNSIKSNPNKKTGDELINSVKKETKMRKIILILLFLISSPIFSQYNNIRLDRKEVPCFVLANESDTIGILFSVPDVQKIDRNLELLEFLEKKASRIDTTRYYYISLIADLDSKIDLLESNKMDLLSQHKIKDSMIKSLQNDIKNLESQKSNLEVTNSNNQMLIDDKNKQIKKQVFLKNLYLTVGIVIITIITVLNAGQ